MEAQQEQGRTRPSRGAKAKALSNLTASKGKKSIESNAMNQGSKKRKRLPTKDEGAKPARKANTKRQKKPRTVKEREAEKEAEEEEKEEETEMCEMDYILKERTVKGSKQYLVRWVDGGEDTWVDAKDIKGTAALQDWKDSILPEEEFEETPEQLKVKVSILAQLIKESQRMVVHTGAGISTSAGVPDFRGKSGLWVRGAKKRADVDLTKVAPTPTHNAITELEKMGKVHWLVSQNYDNLHMKSGFPANKISEMHGNLFIEICDACGHRYLRDYPVMDDDAEDHSTGRFCEQEGCKGALKDNIVHFGEHFEPDVVETAIEKSKEADLAFCLGSKLTVTPSCEMPFYTPSSYKVAKGKPLPGNGRRKVVIVNLQATPQDPAADLVIHHYCDEVLNLLMKLLKEDGNEGTGNGKETEANEKEEEKEKEKEKETKSEMRKKTVRRVKRKAQQKKKNEEEEEN